MFRSPDEGPKAVGAVRRPWAGRLFGWFDERYRLASLIEFLREKDVPITGMAFWYYFGGIALFLFVVQVITGILLLMYYVPTADQAYESVQYLMAKAQFGWLIRSIHAWSANLLILSVLVHLFSVFFTRAYRNPREFTWLTGFGLLGLMLAFGFSGYLLPWNQRAFFATIVGTDILGQLPLVGPFLLTVLRGGEDVTGATLGRFFGLHVAILPGLATLLLAAHLLVIQRQGMSRPAAWLNRPPSQRRSMPFFPNFMLRDLLLWFVILNALAAVAVFWPAEMGVKADAFAAAPAGIKPEWYFLAQYQVLRWMPAKIGPISGEQIGVLGMLFGGLLVFLLPFLDRATEGQPRRRGLDFLGAAALAGLIVLTVIGYVSR